MPHTFAYISLGSNMGDTRAHLDKALDAISNLDGLSLMQASTIYRTEPQGVREQPWFANQVIKVACSPTWTPSDLLHSLLALETRLGRVRTTRWGPRVIDLDLLLFGNTVCHDPRVTLPHPRMLERAFVLIPLLEIEPELVLPDGTRASQALDAISHTIEGDTIWQTTNEP
ncbi:2-amino-4-hydroxy-6-hydroxymethyldihydropteridine diphosphokinase [Desulfoplanes formicivorans]|uniref:2-amino-4-hydroxy-6-hydroxymethyldihydropteridine pyrophosphokinase n=1 Tax=Desulfoplanes formicivorans TaxID=1592317 RepID=A0A194AKN8_9BACT|nr:2-amino-4-hydroxy-6-hydroxymethyldihydropteridine diphosphokinase [Desulfoplanes formicivorans]GAU09274.1 2-amino-4-hydroxy-6-hydroxymethyldihydropteridine pyrophosphokinase [Desulfoplanes formicivorans]